MIEDFIYSFLILLGEEGKIKDLTIAKKILQDIIESNEDFNHISLCYESTEWLFPLPNSLKREIQVKIIDIKFYY